MIASATAPACPVCHLVILLTVRSGRTPMTRDWGAGYGFLGGRSKHRVPFLALVGGTWISLASTIPNAGSSSKFGGRRACTLALQGDGALRLLADASFGSLVSA